MGINAARPVMIIRPARFVRFLRREVCDGARPLIHGFHQFARLLQQLPEWVESGKSRSEHIWAAPPQEPDVTSKMGAMSVEIVIAFATILFQLSASPKKEALPSSFLKSIMILS